MEFDCLKRGKPNGRTIGLLIEGRLTREHEADICSSKVPMMIESATGQDITCTPDDPVKCPYFKVIEKRKFQNV